MNTKFHYRYRCAGGYNYRGEVVCKGQLTEEQISRLLEDGDEAFFIAEQVGFVPLQPSDYDDELDHCWHSLEDIEIVEDSASNISVSAQKFYDEFIKDDWNEDLSWVNQ